MKLSKNPQIYIVDKSKTYSRVVESMLKAMGYLHVETFSDSQTLIDFGLQPDILILDYEAGASSINGLEFYRRYANDLFPHTRVIFLSSNTNLEVAVSAIRMGAYDYIVKSKIGLERLVTRLEKLVRNHRLNYRKSLYLRGAMYSLGMLSFIFVVALILYTNNPF